MNKREQIEMQRIKQENEMLREKISQHMRIYAETLTDVIELKARLDAARFALGGEQV